LVVPPDLAGPLLDGKRMQSVPGGTHWGGGVSISARDQARVGQLLLDGGVHDGTAHADFNEQYARADGPSRGHV